MMTNVFIMHTQYNLLLSLAIKKQLFNDDTNILFIHSEFNISDELIISLKKEFDDVVVFQRSFKNFHRMKQFKHIKKIVGMIDFKKFEPIDRCIISQDNYVDTLIITKFKKSNAFEIIAVEEDCYHGLSTEMFSKQFKREKRSLARKIYNLLLRFTFGKNEYYEHGPCYAVNSKIQSIYVLFQNNIRKELINKNIIQVDRKFFLGAINQLYSHVDLSAISLKSNKKKVLVFLDLLERYNNYQTVFLLLTNLINSLNSKGYTIFIKYHPRETNKPFADESVIEIDNLIPAEKILAEIENDKSAFVIGNKTTVVQMARFFEIKAASICSIINEESNSCSVFFKAIGVLVPSSFEELFDYIKY